MKIVFEIDAPGVKKPYHLKNNVFIIYSPRTITIDTASCIKIDTNVILHLPKKKQRHLSHQNSEGKRFMKLTKKKEQIVDRNIRYFL